MFRYFYGTPDRIRTYDLLLRKQTLYPTELRVQMWTYLTRYVINIHLKIEMGITISRNTYIVPHFHQKRSIFVNFCQLFRYKTTKIVLLKPNFLSRNNIFTLFLFTSHKI